MRAIVARHTAAVERSRAAMLARTGDSTELRDWLACLVRPLADHLDALGPATWFARFGAQVTTDPALRKIMRVEALESPTLQRVVRGLNRCLPSLPPATRLERDDLGRLLLVHAFAERERAVAEGRPTPRRTYAEAADGLVDALAGIWLAPVSATSAGGSR